MANKSRRQGTPISRHTLRLLADGPQGWDAVAAADGSRLVLRWTTPLRHSIRMLADRLPDRQDEWNAAAAGFAGFVKRCMTPDRHAIGMAAGLLDAVATPPDLSWFEALYGPLSPAHAFRHKSNLFGFQALERHYTTILAAFMQPVNVPRRVAHQRARAFVEAVAAAAEIDLPLEGRPGPQTVVEVEAEAPFGTGRAAKRLDLLFTWTADSRCWALGIEVKFGRYNPHLGQLGSCPGRWCS